MDKRTIKRNMNKLIKSTYLYAEGINSGNVWLFRNNPYICKTIPFAKSLLDNKFGFVIYNGNLSEELDKIMELFKSDNIELGKQLLSNLYNQEFEQEFLSKLKILHESIAE